MRTAKKYSDDWEVLNYERGSMIIQHVDGKFYEVVKGPYGNPVIYQPTGGRVYFTLVNGKEGEKFVLCEEELVYKSNFLSPTRQLRAVRASLDNPSQPDLASAARFLGEGYSNTQRILGPPDTFWLIELDANPDPAKYRLLTFEELIETGDNFGKAALCMYLVRYADIALP
jgi:hypothetical protein